MNVPKRNTDLSGRRFGLLTVITYAGIKKYASNRRRTLWKCACDCGKEKIIESTSLYTGNTKSCGHLQLQKATTHGHCSNGIISPEHAAWNAMLNRCGPKAKGRNRTRYFERGILVCKRWKKFKNFLKDIGLRPDRSYSLDRKNNNKGYSPSNCRWATKSQQANNMQSNRIVVYNGMSKTIGQWCKLLSLPYKKTWRRIVKYGWPVGLAFKG